MQVGHRARTASAVPALYDMPQQGCQAAAVHAALLLSLYKTGVLEHTLGAAPACNTGFSNALPSPKHATSCLLTAGQCTGRWCRGLHP